MSRLHLPILALAVVLTGPPAVANEFELEPGERDREHLQSKYGFSVDLGASLGSYRDSKLDGVADGSSSGLLRLMIGTRASLAAEVRLRLGTSSFDIGNRTREFTTLGAESGVVFHILRDYPVQPYVGAGLGWLYFVERSQPEGMGRERDHVLVAPLSVGVLGRLGRVLLDLRGAYRLAFRDELGNRLAGDARLRSRELSLSIGVEF